MNKKNHGLRLDLEKQHQTEEDYIFGAFSQKSIANVPLADREAYLPKGEYPCDSGSTGGNP